MSRNSLKNITKKPWLSCRSQSDGDELAFIHRNPAVCSQVQCPSLKRSVFFRLKQGDLHNIVSFNVLNLECIHSQSSACLSLHFANAYLKEAFWQTTVIVLQAKNKCHKRTWHGWQLKQKQPWRALMLTDLGSDSY